MKLTGRSSFTYLLTGLFAIITALTALPAVAQTSVIEGTWTLVSRTLPDGAMVTAPNLQGLMNFSDGYRHISVVFRTPDGQLGSFSALATYRISATEYTESRLFRVFDDPSSGKGVDYQSSGEAMRVPVEKKGRQVRIKAPFDPVSWSFDGDTMKAAASDGTFEDRWERVK